ncbi:MAG: hypothetical protein DRJ38_02425 [Thermoprotei archaeon]|nr:MAG: hypothetical protein DRJ38_02425 [Thermoprotei archaeon]
MDSIEEILRKKHLFVLFYGNCFIPLSLVCLKYLQNAQLNSKGLYFLQGRTATPAYLSKVLGELDIKFIQRLTIVPLLDPLYQFIVVNTLDTFVDNYDWTIFDDFFANFLIIRGLAKNLRTISIMFEQISKLKEISRKHSILIIITAVEEIKSIVPIDRVKDAADVVVRVEHREGEIVATIEE